MILAASSLIAARIISWFTFFNRSNSATHCSSVGAPIFGTRTVASIYPDASPLQN